MSLDNGGVATYVRPEESIEAKVASFYGKIAHPMLTDIVLDFGEIETFDMFPRKLPDLFHGSQIVALGRYDERTTGDCTDVSMLRTCSWVSLSIKAMGKLSSLSNLTGITRLDAAPDGRLRSLNSIIAKMVGPD